MGLRAEGREGFVALARKGAHGVEQAACGVGQNADQFRTRLVRHAEEGQNAPAPAAAFDNGAGKLLHGQDGDVVVGDGFLIMEHHAPRSAAARLSVSVSQSGTYRPRQSTMRQSAAGGRTLKSDSW